MYEKHIVRALGSLPFVNNMQECFQLQLKRQLSSEVMQRIWLCAGARSSAVTGCKGGPLVVSENNHPQILDFWSLMCWICFLVVLDSSLKLRHLLHVLLKDGRASEKTQIFCCSLEVRLLVSVWEETMTKCTNASVHWSINVHETEQLRKRNWYQGLN